MPKVTDRLSNAKNSSKTKIRKSINIDEADNGFIITMHNNNDFETRTKFLAKNMKEVKQQIGKML